MLHVDVDDAHKKDLSWGADHTEAPQIASVLLFCNRQTSADPVLAIKTNNQMICFEEFGNIVASWEPLAAQLPVTQQSLAGLSPAPI